ncbi:MAG: saccharopine dehydrogenase family protein, partial [Parvularculaceae bacterium]
TGRLVAEYLARRRGGEPDLKWAMAGRDEGKLAGVRDEIGAAPETPLLFADAGEPQSLDDMAVCSRLILSTVGPYQRYGFALVEACANSGTDYVDLCGEPAWMREMIDAHETTAKGAGARIVFSCGFDSVPFDLGVLYLQNEAKRRFGVPCAEIKARVRKMKGSLSGGTVASLKATIAACKDPSVAELLDSPFALTPGFEGPAQPPGEAPLFDDSLNVWLAPFIMAPINTKNIHRSNMLLGHAYGANFRYSEMLVAGPGERGEKIAAAIASGDALAHDDAPKPGEGPSTEEREAGHYDILFIGEMADGRIIRASVAGDADPGYGSTSKMIAESALCLLSDSSDTPGGVWTPASALGEALTARLERNAGLTFRIE